MPTDVMHIPDVAMAAGMPFACLGVAFALRVLLESFGQPGPVPIIFNERVCPLCGAKAPLGVISSIWADAHSALPLPLPRQSAVHDFVLLVVSRLELTLKELVIAYAIVEQLTINQPTCAQAHSLRPIFLISCVIAIKITHDVRYEVGMSFDSVRDVFTKTSIPMMKLMEKEVLSMLNFDLPIGNIHQLCAPNPTREPTGYKSHGLLPPPSLSAAHRC